MQHVLVLLLNVLSGLLFVPALIGLARRKSARGGLRFAVAGLAVSAVTALVFTRSGGLLTVATGLAIGLGTGVHLARDRMRPPENLIAGLHAAGGLAALSIAAAALYAPFAFGIGAPGAVSGLSLAEIAAAASFGAVTFAGSSIVLLTLGKRLKAEPVLLPGRHLIHGAIVAAILILTAMLAATESHLTFWLITLQALALGALTALSLDRVEMEEAAPLYGSFLGWSTAATGFVLGNPALIIAGALAGGVTMRIAGTGGTQPAKAAADEMPSIADTPAAPKRKKQPGQA